MTSRRIFSSLWILCSVAFLLTVSVCSQTKLEGLRCNLEPSKRVDVFKMPFLPADGKEWLVTNEFGNRVKGVDTNANLPFVSLPKGIWQHTGVDYLLGGSSELSQNRAILSIANGIVVFSTQTDPNPVPKRGGLVVVRHLAPPGTKFTVVRYNGSAGTYEAFETEELFSYYLHLDKNKILVKTGDNVNIHQQIAQTYAKKDLTNGTYAYVPHLHFEIWSACSGSDLNGYEPDGTLKNSLRKPVIDPISFLSNVKIKGEPGNTGTGRQTPSKPPSPTSAAPEVPTLFLFDVSSSMAADGKIESARAAGLQAIAEMKENRRLAKDNSPVSIWSFSGDCRPNSSKQHLPFSTNLNQAESVMRSQIPAPNGNTPLPQAIDRSVEQLKSYLDANPNVSLGRVIILSDGESTCGAIRPKGVYSQARSVEFQRISILTIGYGISAGSQAERDLQYLASASGGRYFPASDGVQLSRAFEKTIRIYLPKIGSAGAAFQQGVAALLNRDFKSALRIWTEYVTNNPRDPLGIYNLGLTCEALELYRKAAESYRLYRTLNANGDDLNEVSNRIRRAEDEYRAKLIYFAALLRSDLNYLKEYYQRLFSVKNAELSNEFAGFVDEKRGFYADLPEVLETNQLWVRRGSQELTESLGRLNSRISLPSFDRDAVSMLPLSIAQLEEMLEALESFNEKTFR